MNNKHNDDPLDPYDDAENDHVRAEMANLAQKEQMREDNAENVDHCTNGPHVNKSAVFPRLVSKSQKRNCPCNIRRIEHKHHETNELIEPSLDLVVTNPFVVLGHRKHHAFFVVLVFFKAYKLLKPIVESVVGHID